MKKIEEDINKWKGIDIELILSKYPYDSKQYTDSTQSVLKFQWQFSEK